MSDTPIDGSWWLGVDGRWYSPDDWPEGQELDSTHTAAGRGWWLATDGRWYPPTSTSPDAPSHAPTTTSALPGGASGPPYVTPPTVPPSLQQPVSGSPAQWGRSQRQWGEPRTQWGGSSAVGPAGARRSFPMAPSPISTDESSAGLVLIRSLGGALLAAAALGLAWYLLVSELARRHTYLTGFGALLWALLFIGGVSVAFFASDQRRRTGLLPGVLAGTLAAVAIVVAGRHASETMMIPSHDALFGDNDLNLIRQFGPPVIAAVGGLNALRTKWEVANRRVTTASYAIVAILAIALAGTVAWRSDAPLRTSPLFNDGDQPDLTPRRGAPGREIKPGDPIAPPTTAKDLTQEIIKNNAEAFERDRANRLRQAQIDKCLAEKREFQRRVDAVANRTMFYEELTMNTRGEFFELQILNPRPDGDGTIAFEWRLVPIGEILC